MAGELEGRGGELRDQQGKVQLLQNQLHALSGTMTMILAGNPWDTCHQSPGPGFCSHVFLGQSCAHMLDFISA